MCTVTGVQLGEDVLYVRLGGLLVDGQVIRDLLVGFAIGNVPQYFDFTVGQGRLTDVSCNG